MYKAIIVDDEAEVRTGIVNKINWAMSGFLVPAQAENGREALELVEEDVPDVVITDITMPLMDGLELACVLQERFPTVKTVILTGFDDFKFAQQAIRYGVADYLLKPVLPSDIDQLMGKLRSRLEAETAEKEDIDRLRRNYRDAMPILREKFLSSLVSGAVGFGFLAGDMLEIRLDLACGAIAVAAVRVDDSSLDGSMLAAENGPLAPIAVLETAREVLGKHGSGEAFLHEDCVAVLLGFGQEGTAEPETMAIRILEEIRQTVEKFLKITVTIGLGGIVTAKERIHECFRAARSALEYRVVLGGNRVICHRDIEPGGTDCFSFDESRERQLATGLKFGMAKDVEESIDRLFHELVESRAAPADQQLFFLELLAAVSRVARAYCLDPAEAMGAGSDLVAQVSRLDSPGKARAWFTAVCLGINRRIRGIHQASSRTILHKAKEYIQSHYADNDLSAQKLADHLHISSSYLNMIFKKEAGVSFLKYLVRVRLEAATGLLAGTDLKTAEIAERIGYPDINYFSYFFKKHYGVSPREYRNQLKMETCK